MTTAREWKDEESGERRKEGVKGGGTSMIWPRMGMTHSQLLTKSARAFRTFVHSPSLSFSNRYLCSSVCNLRTRLITLHL